MLLLVFDISYDIALAETIPVRAPGPEQMLHSVCVAINRSWGDCP